MLDIRRIREESESLREALARRGGAPDFAPILERDTRRRAVIAELQAHRSRQKDLSRQIGDLKREGRDTEPLMAQVRGMGDRIAPLERQVREEAEAVRGMMLDVPNTPHPSVPDGRDERSNREVRRWGSSRAFNFQARDHLAVGESLGIIDLQRAAKIAGARFPLMMGAGAALERALLNFMLDLHTRRHGYYEVLPPFLVNAESAIGTGQLPKFEADLFKTGEDELYLTPTAEVPLANIHRDETLPERLLPVKFTAFTPCFRREAGSYGKETRGLIRQHQFGKVELVKFTSAETSYDELESLTADAEEILQRLEIPYRVVVLCAGDLGFSAAKTYDIEVWLPARQGYLEISSCSNFEDFQARRIGVRYRTQDGRTNFAHTLNGSGLAIGRTIVAILENFQQQDGSVEIPMVLRPYMGGMETIARARGPWMTKGGAQPLVKVSEEADKEPGSQESSGDEEVSGSKEAPGGEEGRGRRGRGRRGRNRKGRGGQRGDGQGQGERRDSGGQTGGERGPEGNQGEGRQPQGHRSEGGRPGRQRPAGSQSEPQRSGGRPEPRSIESKAASDGESPSGPGAERSPGSGQEAGRVDNPSSGR